VGALPQSNTGRDEPPARRGRVQPLRNTANRFWRSFPAEKRPQKSALTGIFHARSWGAHAPRVLLAAPRRNGATLADNKVSVRPSSNPSARRRWEHARARVFPRGCEISGLRPFSPPGFFPILSPAEVCFCGTCGGYCSDRGIGYTLPGGIWPAARSERGGGSKRSTTSERRSCWPKDPWPCGLRRLWALASLLTPSQTAAGMLRRSRLARAQRRRNKVYPIPRSEQ
jgi:hypothetical protein